MYGQDTMPVTDDAPNRPYSTEFLQHRPPLSPQGHANAAGYGRIDVCIEYAIRYQTFVGTARFQAETAMRAKPMIQGHLLR